MNKKIKIIELLQDFADEKEIIMPKYIRYWDRIGHKDEVMLVCKANIINKLDDCKIDLNDEVEILEDNTEEIEEIEEIEELYIEKIYNTEVPIFIKESFELCQNKINELVKAINEIRKEKNNER